ncbi:hypothetical protein, partial [Klebsiella pneumoniae]|uniref:hypothetical protein n=1 Tax=Klebsiella pneumoniae TaxID=573 RepID=UPI00114D487C
PDIILTDIKHWLATQFQMKDLGEAQFVLGIQIVRNRKNKTLALSQASYIDKMLIRYKMQDSKKGLLPFRHAHTRTLLKRSRSVGGATHKGIPPVSFLAPYGFTRPLTRTHASIDCYKKEIVFHPSMGKSFRFQGTKLGSVPKTITALKARKLIGHGAVAFLASVVEVGRVDTDVSTVPVVNEFPL